MNAQQRRHECEVRHVLNLPFAKRAPYLALVGERRGQPARQALEADIARLHHARRKSA